MQKVVNAKRFLIATTLAMSAAAAPALAADVGVSISIGQPGFYGRIDIGDFPPPVLVYPQPIVVHRAVGVVYEPIYLHVPPGHARKWSNYCGQYNACGRPVYFVQGGWYNDVYVPKYRERHGGPGKHGKDDGPGRGNKGNDKGSGKGHGKD
jgi:hypothetical protein